MTRLTVTIQVSLSLHLPFHCTMLFSVMLLYGLKEDAMRTLKRDVGIGLLVY